MKWASNPVKKQKWPEEEGQRAQSKVAPGGHDPENALCGWEATMRFEIEIADGNFRQAEESTRMDETNSPCLSYSSP